jgi:2-oxo-3-hexenedioate decarboxylase
VIEAADVAQQLVAAERERKSIGQFSDAHPDFDLATAYQAQRLFVDAKLAAG